LWKLCVEKNGFVEFTANTFDLGPFRLSSVVDSDIYASSHLICLLFSRAPGEYWMSAKGIKRDIVLPISRGTQPAFRAAIVDRDSMSSGLLADSLARNLGCNAVAVRPSDLLQLVGTHSVDLVAISADFSARSGIGFDLARAVSAAHPEVAIVVMLDKPCQKSVLHAFRSGARGLFCRQQSMSDFLDCVESVRKGRIWAGGEETSFLLNAFKSIPAPIELRDGDASVLTVRESQVVRHAATGKTNKMIANEMHLSEHTIKNYLFRAFEKLGVSSRVELLFHLTTCDYLLDPLVSGQTSSPIEDDKAN
jgi:two-component system nitrate/nitrite response regulator NarL